VEDKKTLTERHQQHREENYWHEQSMKNWRAWGSWFSWGSPIGLSLFYAIMLLSTGVFLWLIHQY
jgi:hypothetical protein